MFHSTAIVVPCYNEAKRLPVENFIEYACRHENISFIFINDGSKDCTGHILDALCKKKSDTLEVIHLEDNGGKGEAVRIGFLHALKKETDTVGYWDADLSAPLSEIDRLISVLQRNPDIEAVLGARVLLLGRHIQRRKSRHYIGRFFATIFSIILDIPIYDTQCGAKLFRTTPKLRKIISEPFLTKWLFDVEILARFLSLSNKLPRNIQEEPLLEWTHIEGSKIHAFDFPLILSEMYQLWKHYKR